MTLTDHGLRIDVTRGWEARMWVPGAPPPAETYPVIRLSNFPAPRSKETYAADVIDDLRRGQVVASLVQFSPSLADRGLYAQQGVPRLRVEDFDPRALQLQLPGRLGLQRFFSVGGRAFSLYVIARRGPGLAGAVHDLERSLRTLAVTG